MHIRMFPGTHQVKRCLIWIVLKRSALDSIGRSPFLPSPHLHKVELFSAFISHLDDISSWECL